MGRFFTHCFLKIAKEYSNFFASLFSSRMNGLRTSKMISYLSLFVLILLLDWFCFCSLNVIPIPSIDLYGIIETCLSKRRKIVRGCIIFWSGSLGAIGCLIMQLWFTTLCMQQIASVSNFAVTNESINFANQSIHSSSATDTIFPKFDQRFCGIKMGFLLQTSYSAFPRIKELDCPQGKISNETSSSVNINGKLKCRFNFNNISRCGE